MREDEELMEADVRDSESEIRVPSTEEERQRIKLTKVVDQCEDLV